MDRRCPRDRRSAGLPMVRRRPTPSATLAIDLCMAVVPPQRIALTVEEERLHKQIDFDPQDPGFHETLVRSCDAAKPLAESLLKRKAIPKIRLAYFTDPEYNVGSKRSRRAIFEGNGCHGEEILGHGNFLKFLKYFIHGPDLPATTLKGFCELIDRDRDRQELRSYARAEIRSRGLDARDASEEFYKLALECDLDEGYARSVRDAARSTR
jgi:hypothetical protein